MCATVDEDSSHLHKILPLNIVKVSADGADATILLDAQLLFGTFLQIFLKFRKRL